MINYTWTFPHFDVAPSHDELVNVIKTVHWRLTAIDEDYSAEAYGSVSLTDPDPETFIAFEGLTAEAVQGWVESAINGENDQVDQLKASLAAQIEKQKNPPVVTLAAPWNINP
jgi:hypothetical protein